jgi:general secretion pathway protein H
MPGNGFSLVELMVVVAILGLAATAVVLTMQSPGGSVNSEASRLAGRAAAARDRAVVTATPQRVWIAASGYGFEERRPNGWVPISERALQPQNWPAGFAVTANGTASARISFDRLGLPDRAITVELRRGSGIARVTIDAAGSVEVR